MTKLTNDELRRGMIERAKVVAQDLVGDRQRGKPRISYYATKLRDFAEAEILQRMAEGAAGEVSPQKEGNHVAMPIVSKRGAGTPEVSDLHSVLPETGSPVGESGRSAGTNENVDSVISGSASTAGPRPRCPKCGDAELRIGQGDGRFWITCKQSHATEVPLDFEVSDFAQFFAAAPAEERELVVGENCPTCDRRVLPKFGPGDYSCATCGLGMVEPCEHWRKTLAEPQQSEEDSAPEDVQLDVEAEKRIAEIRERESKATKGPWTIKHELNVIAPDPRGGYMSPFSNSNLPHEQILDNVEFAVHARADIPFLLEQLALLRRVSGKGAQARCWKCEAKIPHEWQFCELSPAPVPATPEHMQEVSKGIWTSKKACEVCGETEMLTVMGRNQYACPKHTTQGTPEGAK